MRQARWVLDLLTPQDQLAPLVRSRPSLSAAGCDGPDQPSGSFDRDTACPETALLDHVNQVRRDLWRYRAFAADGTIAEEEPVELSLRWTYRWELRHLLTLAGFAVEAEYSDFAYARPAYGKEQIWIARRV
jgi:hypothetical protein